MRLRQLFENINRTGEGKTAVVGWGRGMGHKGHMMLASSVITHAKDSEGDPYFVVSRSYGPDDPLEPEEKLDIYRKVFPEQGHIFQTATDELPDLTRVLANLNQQGYTNAIIVVGADQKAAFQYLNHYNGKPDKKGNIAFNFDNLQVISRQETSDPSREEEGPRATPMRAVLMDPSKSHDEQFAVWRDAMSPEIDDEEVMALMHKAQQRMTQMAAAKKPKKKQGVAEGKLKKKVAEDTEQDQKQIRQQLNSWMNVDQTYNNNPTERASSGFQAKVWDFIKTHIKTILSDKGEDDKGSYPAAPFAAWLLVQHMDAYPDNQSEFSNWLEQSGLDPTDGKGGPGKLQFIKDRAAVNQEIIRLASKKKYVDKHGKPLTNPTSDVRNSNKFDDAGNNPAINQGEPFTSQGAALNGAKRAKNYLLYKAVINSRATTQPSFKQGLAEDK
jgi:hypothetical protein